MERVITRLLPAVIGFMLIKVTVLSDVAGLPFRSTLAPLASKGCVGAVTCVTSVGNTKLNTDCAGMPTGELKEILMAVKV